MIFAHGLNERIVFTASFSYSLSIVGEHEHGDGGSNSADLQTSLVRPHEAQESTGILGIIYATDVGFIESSVKFGVGFDHGDAIYAPTEIRLQNGINLQQGITVIAGFSQTVHGAPRLPWSIELGFSIALDKSSTPRHEHCQCDSHSGVDPHHPHLHP